jgi:hypothetical protein
LKLSSRVTTCLAIALWALPAFAQPTVVFHKITEYYVPRPDGKGTFYWGGNVTPSIDGNTVVFRSFDNVNTNAWDTLWAANADGSGLRVLANSKTNLPNGLQIANFNLGVGNAYTIRWALPSRAVASRFSPRTIPAETRSPADSIPCLSRTKVYGLLQTTRRQDPAARPSPVSVWARERASSADGRSSPGVSLSWLPLPTHRPRPPQPVFTPRPPQEPTSRHG